MYKKKKNTSTIIALISVVLGIIMFFYFKKKRNQPTTTTKKGFLDFSSSEQSLGAAMTAETMGEHMWDVGAPVPIKTAAGAIPAAIKEAFATIGHLNENNPLTPVGVTGGVRPISGMTAPAIYTNNVPTIFTPMSSNPAYTPGVTGGASQAPPRRGIAAWSGSTRATEQ